MMKMNLEEIKKRVDDATPGKWEARGESNPYISEVEVDNGFGKESIVSSQKHGDIEFIAHARQDVPALIAEVERLSKTVLTNFFEFGELSVNCEDLIEENERLRKALEFYAQEETYMRTADVGYMYANKPAVIEEDEGEIARQAIRGDSDG